MVGRFVHHQNVRFLHHQLTEQHTAFFAAGEHFRRLFDVVLAEQQSAQDAAHRLFVIAFLFPLAHPLKYRQIVFEFIFVILGIVANLRVLGPFNGTVIRHQVADQGFQHCGFTHAVGTQNSDLLPHFQQQVEVFKQRAVVKAFCQRFHFQSVTEQLLILLKANERVLTAGRFHFVQLNFVNLTGARGRLARFRGVGAKAAHERLQVGNLRFFLGVIRQQTFARLGRRGHIFIVVARVNAQLAVIQIRHVGTNHVQEVTVVRNDDHGAVAIVEGLLQPADGIDVQVVRRFIKQQDIRVGEQRLRQQHAQLPAGSHFAHRAVMLFNRDTDAEQQFAGARFGGVAVHLAVQHFKVSHLVTVFFAHLRQGVDAIALLLHFPQLAVAHNDRIQHAELFKRKLILAQLTDTLIRVEGDVAQRRLKIAAEDLHKGGLAATVGANQAVTIAAAKFDGNIFEQRLTAELHGDVAGY